MPYNNIKSKVLTIILFVAVFFLMVTKAGLAEERKIIVIFRYDDYSATSATDLELKIINTFQKYAIPCVFGVIPYIAAVNPEDSHPQELLSLPSLKAEILRQGVKRGILEVALHGYSHQTVDSDPRRLYGYR